MVNLRKAAKGQICQIRIPGYCNHNPETSVLAHYRLALTVPSNFQSNILRDGVFA
ncbi:nuclease domain-containing protein, partial [Escherichia coli]|uniref:nuclease domain-containing protein n=1 Tax=Escherichia coli TaxID=562 RepID=UPI0012FE75A8